MQKRLLGEDEAKTAAAVASTKAAFGQLNVDGIIIPSNHLIFQKNIAAGSFGRVVQGELTAPSVSVGTGSISIH